MNRIGEMISQGNTAEIYDYGDGCILKLYRAGLPEQICRDEFQYTLWVYQATSKAPEPIGIIFVDGRIGAIYKKILGKTMLKQMMSEIWKSGHYAKYLADCHIDMQKPVYKNFLTVKEKLIRDIERVDALSENEKSIIYQNLSNLPDGNVLCHFDFHPDNIILLERHYVIIDWMTACKGDRLSDVARTGIILKFSLIPRVPAIVNMAAGLVQKTVYRKYIDHYLHKTDTRVEDIEKWELPIAAARLCEWIPEKEKQELLKFVRQRISAFIQ